jgi:hypothetical protein
MGLLSFLRSLVGGSPNPKHAAWDDPIDIAALTTPEVARGEKPVLLVIHDIGVGEGLAGWLFLDADTTGGEPTGMAKEELLKMDPTLKEVTDLPVGWQARREAPGKEWLRERL